MTLVPDRLTTSRCLCCVQVESIFSRCIFFFFPIALSSSFVHSVPPPSRNVQWVMQEKFVNFLYSLRCAFSAFGRVCTRSEPLSTLWFETWARKSWGFTWHFSLVTAESLFPTRRKKKKKKGLCLWRCSCAHFFICGNAAISGLERTLVPSWGRAPEDVRSFWPRGASGGAFLCLSHCPKSAWKQKIPFLLVISKEVWETLPQLHEGFESPF